MAKPGSDSPRSLYQRLIGAQNALGKIKAVTEIKREPASILSDIRDILRPGLLNSVDIVIDNINPRSAWPSDSVQIQVTVTNRTKMQTSGTVTADVLQDGFNPIFGSGFNSGKRGALAVTALGPGQQASGTVTLQRWRANPAFL